MRSPLLEFLLLTILLIQLACGGDPTKAVETVFTAYQDAIEKKQFGKAAGLLDQKSVEYYDKIIQLALETERQKLGEVNFNSKVVALALRQEHSKKQIKELNGRQVFAFAAEHHLNPMDSVGQYAIAKIVMEGNFEKAVARMTHNGELTDTYLKFIRENGVWKLNFASIMNEENDSNTSLVLSGIRDENNRAIKIIRAISDKPLKRNIWIPANRW